MRTGLTLGKFAPFHAGHQLLIETALGEVDLLIVVVYNATAHTHVPLSERASWVRELYPEAEVIEAVDGPEVTGLTPEIVEMQNAYLHRLLYGRKVDAFFSSEPYGESVARALGAVNRLVDPDRTLCPVSGTALRTALAELPASAAGSATPSQILLSDGLHPHVRACLLPRVVLLGGPSTGKTTTATALAARLGEPLCLEYGREYWFEHQRNHRLSMIDLETVATGQVRREREAAACARCLLVADTSPLTTLAYAKYYFLRASARLEEIVSVYHAADRLLVLCDTDIPFENSRDRSGPGSRDRLQRINRDELEARRLPFLLVSGSTENRVSTIMNAIGAWRYQC